MPVLFATVARGVTVLAKHAVCSGNFIDVCEQVLAKITKRDESLTYAHGKYLFHYTAEGGIIFLCITDDDFERSKAFSFLADVKQRFFSQYGNRGQTALPYAMNTEFSKVLAAQMAFHGRSQDRVSQVQADVEQLKGIMVKNIDSMVQRGEKLELLVEKTEDLSDSAVTFARTGGRLARTMWWRNFRVWIIIVVVVLVVLFFVVTASCKTFNWSKCGKN